MGMGLLIVVHDAFQPTYNDRPNLIASTVQLHTSSSAASSCLSEPLASGSLAILFPLLSLALSVSLHLILSLHSKSSTANICLSLPSRRLLAYLWRHPHPFIQRIRRLRYHTRTNGRSGWQSGKSAWVADPSVQRQLCVLPSIHGRVKFPPHLHTENQTS